MSAEPNLIAFAFVLFTAYAVQTASGFGSMVVCVALGAHLLPIREVVALVVPMSLLQGTYILARHRDGIQWRLLATQVLPLMGLGTAVGFFAFRLVAGDWLRIAFGVLVLSLALRELWRLHGRSILHAPSGGAEPLLRPATLPVGAIFGAGVLHGVYATGGPLLVYALGQQQLPKHAFRSTLSVVWLVLNTALMAGFVWDGRYEAATLRSWLVLLPAVALGIAAGEILHGRVAERSFRTAVSSLLVMAAVFLMRA